MLSGGTKAEATKATFSPNTVTVVPNSHTVTAAGWHTADPGCNLLAARPQMEGQSGNGGNSSKSRQPDSDLPQLSLITAKLGMHSCPGQSRGQARIKEKSFNKTQTGIWHWEKHGLPLFSRFLSAPSPGALEFKHKPHRQKNKPKVNHSNMRSH